MNIRSRRPGRRLTSGALVGRAFAAGACMSALSVTVPAFAQQSTPSEAGALEEVMVTGSRIARPDFEGNSPVVTLDADMFALSGDVHIENVLNSLPQLAPSFSGTSNNPSNGGQANVDVRGLSGFTFAPRTLVLVDGTRVPPSGVLGLVDLNTIPSALIESVEVLTGGASSTYGSDAIAGVVNVRLKRNFEGMQFNVQQSMTEQSDGRMLQVEGMFGGRFADDRGSAVVALTYDDREDVLAGARDFSRVGRGPTLAPVGSGTVPDGRVDWGANQPSQPLLNQVFGSYGASAGSVLPSAPIGFNPDGTVFSFGLNRAANPVVNYRGDTSDPGFNPLSYTHNAFPINYLQLPLERRQFAALARYELMPDAAEVYTRFMYTSYDATRQLAPTPVTCASQPGCSVPVTNALIPADLRRLLESRTNPTAPLTFTKRYSELGPRIEENAYDVTQGLVGLRGDFHVGDDPWRWDIYASWGRAENVATQLGNISRSRLQSALNDPSALASRGCASFNPFGAGVLSPACASAIGIRATNVLKTEQLSAVASLTGSLFELPAGALQFAAGIEYREDRGAFQPDEFLTSGDVVGFNAAQRVSGKIDVLEPFAELVVPLLRDVTAADYVGLELGYRHSDYNLAPTADTYKVGLQWSPVESLKLRGSYNRAIRAPSINELFLPQQEGFPGYTDPCNFDSTFRTGANGAQVAALCGAQGIPAAVLSTFRQPNTQARAFSGGNKELQPETADTYTFGVSWQASTDSGWARNLAVSIDYFSYEIEDVIGALTASSIIGRCFNQLGTNPTFDPSDAFCQLFSRNPSNFIVTDVDTLTTNLGGLKTTGADINLAWGIDLSALGAGDAGELGFRLFLTRLLSFEQQETATDVLLPREGTISQTVASAYPELKGVLTTTWSIGDFELRHNLRYIDSMDVVNNDAALTPSTGVVPHVAKFVYHDLAARWQASEALSVSLGATNLTDKQPPVYTANAQAGIQSNTDPSTYDVLGRRYFVSATVKF
jgi:iron complex outermembrane recepter protein